MNPEILELPVPEKPRWQLLRAGLQNLWEYDDQRFVFHGGHLLLRGQNESGKTKALELLLPFVLDASLRPERLDPFGSASRPMRWNLVNDMRTGEVAIGYAWLEFGRVGEDGPVYRTVGVGLRAKRSAPEVEDWWFETDLRVDRDLRLLDAGRVPLRKRSLEEALGGRGRVFERAAPYRAAVNDLLFGMPEEQYDALIHALLELRRPQLAKTLDPERLSVILGKSLPPLDGAAIGSLAEGFERLDRHREEREELLRTLGAVKGFLGTYRGYATSFLKARAQEVTRAESAYHAAREGMRIAAAEEEGVKTRLAGVVAAIGALEDEERALEARLAALRASDEYRAIEALERSEEDARKDADAARRAAALEEAAVGELARATDGLREAEGRLRGIEERFAGARERAREAAGRAELR